MGETEKAGRSPRPPVSPSLRLFFRFILHPFSRRSRFRHPLHNFVTRTDTVTTQWRALGDRA